jgi:hypothetical protein
MIQFWNEIYPWVVAGIGGFIGAALLLPTKLGEALVQFRVGKALESFKADQSRELEQLKERLSHLGDRGRRSNEMEFAAIEKVWCVCKGLVICEHLRRRSYDHPTIQHNDRGRNAKLSCVLRFERERARIASQGN